MAMQRREFLSRTARFLAAGLVVPPFLRRDVVWGSRTGGGLAGGLAAGPPVLGGRTLVAINLSGGNDGLNTVVPVTDNLYYQFRPTIAIQPSEAVLLDASTGLHPALLPLKSFYDAGKMAVVHGVTYPDPNLSHFRSTDIWFSGSSSNQTVATGWLARFLEAMFPEFPNVLPPAPYGLQQAFSNYIPLTGNRGQTGVVVDDPNTFFELVNPTYTGEWNDELPDTRGGAELAFVRQVDADTFQYAAAIEAAADAGVNTVAYPQTDLGQQLEIVAKLMSGQLGTPIYLTAEFGFDTHTAQGERHYQILGSVGQSVAAFLADLENQGLAQDVVVVTTSEFGRRPHENGGEGTDHGTAAPLFALGPRVAGGIYGTNPDLSNLDANGNLQLQWDFRSFYTTLLQGQFGATPEIASSVLMGAFDPIGFLDPSVAAGEAAAPPLENRLVGASPNPVSLSRGGRAIIRFDLARPGPVSLRIFDVAGRAVADLANREYPAGRHRIAWNLRNLPAGTYFSRLATPGWEEGVKLLVLR